MLQKLKKGGHLIQSYFDKEKINHLVDASLSERNMLTIIQQLDTDKWSKTEAEALQIIENRRSSLLQDTSSIEVEDFGAGKAIDNRTDNEMSKGSIAVEPVNQICARASSDPKWGRLMFLIVRHFKPKQCLELGTCMGISGSYIMQGLSLNHAEENGKTTGGHFDTFEGSPSIAAIGANTLSQFNYEHFNVHIGRFQDTLPPFLETAQNLDLIFIDGHHDYKATKRYFDDIYPRASASAIFIFDDIHWSDGMLQAWTDIKKDSRITTSFDFYFWGVIFISRKIKTKKHFKVWF